MFRQSIVKATRPATRAFATTARAMGAGDTGSVRPSGQTYVASPLPTPPPFYPETGRAEENLD